MPSPGGPLNRAGNEETTRAHGGRDPDGVSLRDLYTDTRDVARKSGGMLGPLRNNILLRTAVYYIALFAVAAYVFRFPQARDILNDSLDALLNGQDVMMSKRAAAEAAASTPQVSPSSLAVSTAISMLGSVFLMLPVAWIYTLTRKKRGYDQSVVQTLILLPALVAGVVVMVKYSLALAFSLAGIVAAVRFRTTLDDSKDAVYVFLATAVGLAAGVQLPMAAVLSVVFNMIMLALWYTEFGKVPPALEGVVAERRLEEARERLRQTGSFVALLDDEIFADMTPEQLDLTADRAWRRRRRLETDDVSDEDMQKRDALLRVRTKNAEESRAIIEGVLDEFCKKFRFGGVLKEDDGTQVSEYAIQLKKSARGVDLADALHAKSAVIDAEIK
jgi:hypothetical protein